MSCPIIEIDSGFPAETRKDYAKVADSLRSVLDDIFGHANPPLSIPMACRLGSPPRASVDSWLAPSTFLIDVDVSPQDRRYSQFVFQLAHEIGHCYLGVYRSNFGIETVVTALSLDSLSRLARRWKTNPPHRHWIDYAPHFQEYRVAYEQDCIAKCPAKISAAAVARQWDLIKREIGPNVGPMDTSKEYLESAQGRALQGVAAMALLSEPLYWSEFIGIEKCTVPSPDVSSTFEYAPFDPGLAIAKAPSLIWLIK